jgi:hypothetical protein
MFSMGINSNPALKGLNKNYGNTSRAGSVPWQLIPRENKNMAFSCASQHKATSKYRWSDIQSKVLDGFGSTPTLKGINEN